MNRGHREGISRQLVGEKGWSCTDTAGISVTCGSEKQEIGCHFELP